MKTLPTITSVRGSGYGGVPPVPCYRGRFEAAAAGADFGVADRPSPNGPEIRLQTILVPVALDERSARLLRAASSLARQMAGRLILLHVRKTMDFLPPLASAGQMQEWNTSVQRNAEADLAAFREQFLDEPLIREATALVVDGELEEEIVNAARYENADLIVLSTHSYTGLRHVLLGSKAEHIIRRSHCPVLVLPLAETPARKAPRARRKSKKGSASGKSR